MNKTLLSVSLLFLGLASGVEASPLVGEWVCPDIGHQTHLKISADGTFSKNSTNSGISPWSGTWKESGANVVTLTISPSTQYGIPIKGFTEDYRVKLLAGKMSLSSPAGASFENCARKVAESEAGSTQKEKPASVRENARMKPVAPESTGPVKLSQLALTRQVIADRGGEQDVLLRNDRTIYADGDHHLDFAKAVELQSGDLLLLLKIGGDSTCPSRYRFLRIQMNGPLLKTQRFGTCGDLSSFIAGPNGARASFDGYGKNKGSTWEYYLNNNSMREVVVLTQSAKQPSSEAPSNRSISPQCSTLFARLDASKAPIRLRQMQAEAAGCGEYTPN